jgi:hypothetical protein
MSQELPQFEKLFLYDHMEILLQNAAGIGTFVKIWDILPYSLYIVIINKLT